MEARRPLTRKQAQVLRAIDRFVAAEGYGPSMRQLASLLGITAGTAHFHVHSLERRGYLAHDGTDHGIRLLAEDGASAATTAVPVLGTLAPGQPLELHVPPRDSVQVPAHLGGARTHVLEVRGTDLAAHGILDGDKLLIRTLEVLEDGQLAVVVAPDGTAALGRAPLRRRGRPVAVHGHVIGLLREYP